MTSAMGCIEFSVGTDKICRAARKRSSGYRHQQGDAGDSKGHIPAIGIPEATTMAWFYEILGKDDEVVEASESVYTTQFDAQYAAYQRMKEKPSLFGPVPTTGGKVEGGLRHFLMSDHHIRAKQKDES
jgi:hypothetical protein